MPVAGLWRVLGDEEDATARIKVPGGYLYRVIVRSGAVALAFVPKSRVVRKRPKKRVRR